MCEALDEMRECIKTLNFSYMSGLIEEVQSMGNRMESGLYRYGSIEDAEALVVSLKKQIKELEAKKLKLDQGGRWT